MDDLDRRLKEDADRIRADVPSDLRSRINASMRTVPLIRPRRTQISLPLWLAGSLTGAAAAVLAIAVVNWRESADTAPEPAVAYSVPQYIDELERELPLRAKTADLTEPLEDELENLRSDLEKARENVERDLRFTF